MLIFQELNVFQLLLLSLTTISFVHGHGRLLTPMPRALHRLYENAPVLDLSESNPLMATAGKDWVCRHETPTNVQSTLVAGSIAEFDFRLSARHVGDCDFSISYDWDKPLEQMQWFKIANFPNCKDQGSMIPESDQLDMNRVTVQLPSWLRSGRAVLRWGWWGLHNWPSVEFFNQCSDVQIDGVSNLPVDIQTYTLPGVYPKDANEGKGYRNEWNGEKWGTTIFWMTGPACAMDSDINNCLLTAPGTQGHIEISSNPTTSTSTQGPTTTSTSTQGPTTTSTSTQGPTTTSTSTQGPTTTSTSTTSPACASQTFVAIADCMSDALCSVICNHDNGVLCPLDLCECVTETSTTSTTQGPTSTSTSSTSTTQGPTTTSTSTTQGPTTTSTSTTQGPTTTSTSTQGPTTTSTSTTQASTTIQNGNVVDALVGKLEATNSDDIFMYEASQSVWEPSTVYTWSDMISAVEIMADNGIGNKKFYAGQPGESGFKYGMVNVAAFLAQSMQETIRYNACDENNWSSGYPATAACGQLGQSYQHYTCSEAEAHMQCEVDLAMEQRAVTHAQWYGAPAPLFCGPKAKTGPTPKWVPSGSWCNPSTYDDYFGTQATFNEFIAYVNNGEKCKDYKNQKDGHWAHCDGGCPNDPAPVFGEDARTDVEGCCWWGRGVIQTTGVCNFGKLNYFIGTKAQQRGVQNVLYPEINFCQNPGAICDPDGPAELKWIAGLFFWMNEVQAWDTAEFNFLTKLQQWVDAGMDLSDTSFIDAASGIVNRGCPALHCNAGEVHNVFERRANFAKVMEAMLDAMDAPISTSTSMSTTQASTSTSTSTTQTSTSTSTLHPHVDFESTPQASTSTTSTTQGSTLGDQVRICYFQNWARYWPLFGSEDVFEKGLDSTLCTHIQYGFVGIEDSTWDLKATDPNADFPGGHRDSPCPSICKPGFVHDWNSGTNPCAWPCGPDRKRRGFDGMLKLKEENPSIKLIASVGGWNFNDCLKTDQANTGAFSCHIFSTIASSETHSRAHALKVIAFLRKWEFDGYDLDWEYPVTAGHNNIDMQSRPDDYANYIRFLQILKEEFENEAANAIDGRERLLLTAAVGVGKNTVDESYDIPAMNSVLDLISLMTYDMNGAWEPTTTNFNAPLHATAMDVQLKGYPLSVEWAVDYWLGKGASPDKLVLGMATYGRGWSLANPGQNQGALSAANGKAPAGPLTKFAGYLAYSEIQDMIQNQGAVEYWDSERKVPYMISADGAQWVGYDDNQSLTLKTDFLMSRNLRGAMFWALELDDVTGANSGGQVYPLMNTVKTTMNGYRSQFTSSTPNTVLTTTSTSSTTASTTTTSTNAPNCVDIMPTSDCVAANQNWNMCTNSSAWWIEQCQATCNEC